MQSMARAKMKLCTYPNTYFAFFLHLVYSYFAHRKKTKWYYWYKQIKKKLTKSDATVMLIFIKADYFKFYFYTFTKRS